MTDSPRVFVPPPLIFAIVFFAGFPFRDWLPRVPMFSAGVLLAGIAFAFSLWALAQMVRARTNPEPWKPSTRMVISGRTGFLEIPSIWP